MDVIFFVLRALALPLFLIFLILNVFFFLSYFIAYKRLIKGKQQLLFRDIMLWELLFCYILIVLGATLLIRYPSDFAHVELQLFSQHRSAWYNFSMIEWQNIIMNIAMFIPIGVLTSILLKKIRTIWKIGAICLASSILIELTQLITRRGIFSLDDILHNTLGGIIGYSLFCFTITVIDGKPFPIKKIIVTLIPVFVTLIVSLSIYVAYVTKEFGIMTPTYVHRVDMTNVILSNEVELCSEPAQAMIYEVMGILDTKEITEFAENFLSNLNATIDETRTLKNRGSTVFFAQSPTGQTATLNISNYLTYFYNYPSNDSFRASINENNLRDKLLEIGIYIPESALFSELDIGEYRFDIAVDSTGDLTVWGWLECVYYDDGTIRQILNHIVEVQSVRMVDIITPYEAFKRIEGGMFRYYSPNQISYLHIVSYEITHYMDTKGFLQPVYRFEVEIDGVKQDIVIPAVI